MSFWGFRHGLFETRKGELEEEIRAHLAMDVQARMERGQSREEAEAAARLEFGNVALVRDVTHRQWGWKWLEWLAQDLRFALRQLRKSPGFTITVILTLALGIGANTAIFSLTYALLLRSLPIAHPEQLVQLRLQSSNPNGDSWLSTAFFEQIQQRQRVFSTMCAWQGDWFTGEQNGDGRIISAAKITGDCLPMLGLRPAAGRLLTPEDEKPGTGTVDISYAYWQTRFHGDPGIVGKTINLMNPFSQAVPLTVVGVLPNGFQSIQVADAPSIFIPNQDRKENSSQNNLIFARLRDGVTPEQAAAQLAPGYAAWVASLGSLSKAGTWDESGWFKKHPRLLVVPSSAGFSPLGMAYKEPLMLLQALVGVLLLASCVYLGTLLSARSIARRREIAVRSALGASRGRLIRQLLSESLLLAFAGSVLGIFFAWSASRFLLTFVQTGAEPSKLAIGPGRDVLLFTLAVATMSVFLWGLLPAMRGSRVSFAADMKGSAGSLLSGERGKRFGRWLVPVQIALSLLIVVVAGLLSTTLVKLLTQNNGYRLRGTVFANTDFPWVMGKDAAGKLPARIELYRTILDRLNHIPQIDSASIDMIHALAGGAYMDAFSTSALAGKTGPDSQSIINRIGPRYFETVGTHVLKGRDFDVSDTQASQPVCILTRGAERHFFPQGHAIGRMLYDTGAKEPARGLLVVGVVEDTRYNDLRSEAPIMVYLDYTQMQEVRPMEFVMKSDDPAAAIASLRDVLRTVAPGVHVTETATMEQEVGASLSRERLLATLSSFFAILGLLLGAISLYGVLSYSVNRRTAEIGVRMALGASQRSVVRLIVGEAAQLVVPGVVVGGFMCVVATRMMRSLLYETKPLDPLATVLSFVAIVLTALLASWLPARRASRIDLVQSLRAE
jgi:predicted permease